MPRRPSLFGALGALVALLATAACGDGTAPAPAAGTYVLRNIADAALPVTFYAGIDGTYSVVADTIELGGRGRADRVFLVRVVNSIYHGDTVYGGRYAQDYQLNGARFEIGSFTPCPPNANCAPNDTGYLLGGMLTLHSNRTGQLRRWTYERVAPAR
jgi:hypothetical protein